jgi:hypothetical protein
MKTQKNSHEKKQVLFWSSKITILLFLVALISMSYMVCAHAPIGITVSYNLETQDLRVIITHPVSDQTTHYIKEVKIEKNGVLYNTSLYDSQPDSNSFTYTYQINATTGDTIDVTASCIQGGSKTIQHTVVINNGESKKSTPGFEVIVLLGAVVISLVILQRK